MFLSVTTPLLSELRFIKVTSVLVAGIKVSYMRPFICLITTNTGNSSDEQFAKWIVGHYEGEVRVAEMNIQSIGQNSGSHTGSGRTAHVFPLLLNELLLETAVQYELRYLGVRSPHSQDRPLVFILRTEWLEQYWFQRSPLCSFLTDFLPNNKGI